MILFYLLPEGLSCSLFYQQDSDQWCVELSICSAAQELRHCQVFLLSLTPRCHSGILASSTIGRHFLLPLLWWSVESSWRLAMLIWQRDAVQDKKEMNHYFPNLFAHRLKQCSSGYQQYTWIGQSIPPALTALCLVPCYQTSTVHTCERALAHHPLSTCTSRQQ